MNEFLDYKQQRKNLLRRLRRKTHPEIVRKKDKEQYYKDHEVRKQRKREYNNRPKVKERQARLSREHYLTNKQKIIKRMKKKRRDNPLQYSIYYQFKRLMIKDDLW